MKNIKIMEKVVLFDFNKAKEKARQLYHFCQLMKEYSKFVCNDICTEEEERSAVVINYIAKLSDSLYCDFIRDEIEC